jgi:proteasome lid subunit RPN8/RPN11
VISWVEQSPEVHSLSIEYYHRNLTVLEHLRILLSPEPAFYIVFPDVVKASVLAHLRQGRVELGGLLIGRVFRQCESIDSPPVLVEIQTSVPCVDAESTGVSLRMESSVWRDAGKFIGGSSLVVGWYHSHPNLGAFFSGTDRRTQRSFFNQDFNLGLVIDHIRSEEAWFIGPNSVEVSCGFVRSEF